MIVEDIYIGMKRLGIHYNGFIQELYEKIIYEKNKTGDTKLLYKMMASYQYHLTHADEYYDMVMNVD